MDESNWECQGLNSKRITSGFADMEVSVSNTVDWAARPKVHQFGLFELINHDILRFNVTMADVIRAQPIHSSDYAIDKAKLLAEGE